MYLFRIVLGVRGFPCGSLLFLSVSFRSRRFGASNGFIFLEGLFYLARAKTQLRLSFCSEFSFPFSFLLRLPI